MFIRLQTTKPLYLVLEEKGLRQATRCLHTCWKAWQTWLEIWLPGMTPRIALWNSAVQGASFLDWAMRVLVNLCQQNGWHTCFCWCQNAVEAAQGASAVVAGTADHNFNPTCSRNRESSRKRATASLLPSNSHGCICLQKMDPVRKVRTREPWESFFTV